MSTHKSSDYKLTAAVIIGIKITKDHFLGERLQTLGKYY